MARQPRRARPKTKSTTRSAAKTTAPRRSARRAPRAPSTAEVVADAARAAARGLVHPSVWFRQDVANELWMPSSNEGTTFKPLLQRKKKKLQAAPAPPAAQPPQHIRKLCTSWWEVQKVQEAQTSWSPHRDPLLAEEQKPRKRLSARQQKQSTINSAIKIKLVPTMAQRLKLQQMFSAHRAVYNKLIDCSREDYELYRLKRLTKKSLLRRVRPASSKHSLASYFRNKRAASRHLECYEEVLGGAFQDFKKAIDSSSALYWSLKEKKKKTSFPRLRYKSCFDRSDAIQLRVDRRVHVDTTRLYVLFHQNFFEGEWFMCAEPLPELEHSIKLQRERDGDFYLCFSQTKTFEPTTSTRTCAIDPGVRQFLALYDPDGRVFTVADPEKHLQRHMEWIDKDKRELSKLEKQIQENAGRGSATTRHRKRQRYRLRRSIRFLYRKITRLVHDLHQKVSKWISENYHEVLLPSFQTSQMVRRYIHEEALDVTPRQLMAATEHVELRGRRRKIRKASVRAMLAQSHYKFKQLLKYKMKRTGGRVHDVGEEYTSKTCSSCGFIDKNLGAKKTYTCPSCSNLQDRDLNAARNIFLKNVSVSTLRSHFTRRSYATESY